MSRFFEPTDRRLLIGAAVLLVLLVIAAALLGPAQVSGSATLPSSYSPAWGGAEGAYLLLGNLGYQVQRWESPASELNAPAGHTVWILADPTVAPNADDRGAIRHFLESGGEILATGSTAAKFLPGASAFTESTPWEGWQRFPALIPSPLTRGAREITMLPPENWHPHSLSQVAIFGDPKTAAVVSWRFGGGRIVWWAAATPLTNGGIRQPGNLALLLNSIGPAAGTRVLWDEYYHGVRGTLWSFLAPTPAPWILVQFGLVLLALLFTYSRRQGPARMPEEPSRLSPLEFVETLGDLYYAARAGSSAVETAAGRLRFLLTHQLGLRAGAAAEEISRSAGRRLGWNQAALSATLDRAERAMRNPATSHEDALQLVREIHAWIARLQIDHAQNRKENK
ncbi:MAG TPA: DUF4350 domain-containing protein [Candidatus Dormibacteraeota bacterium]|nr:DUF4350 domain-containing protein [Candidatus Dormibacteraeota bacterium]